MTDPKLFDDYDEEAEKQGAEDQANYERYVETACYSDPAATVPAPIAPTSTQEPLLLENSRVKVEHAARLRACLVLHFESLVTITKESHYEGALLVELMTADRVLEEVWIPKKLCSNLNIDNNTVCVWDKFLSSKLKELDDLGGLAYEPEYFKEEK